MRPIDLSDLIGRDRYAGCRDEIRRRIVAHKRLRRVAVGDRLSLLFEDRATVWYQTQEMLWVERIVDLDAIRVELDVYNALLPAPGELSATLFVEIEEQSRIRDHLDGLRGLGRHVHLDVGGTRVTAVFEEGRETDDRISAVQYVRFPLQGRLAALRDGAPLHLTVDHPAYAARVALDDAVRASVVGELLDETRAETALAAVREGWV